MVRRRVVFVVLPNVHLLDIAGPAQVFSAANDCGGNYMLHFVGDGDRVVSHQGLALDLETDWPKLSANDLVMVPGWRVGSAPSPRRMSAKLAERLREHHQRGGLVASVCVGVQALAETGLLDGRRCTTHFEIQDALAQRYPKTTVVRDVLFVEDDRVITSAGIASGIDMSLHLVARWQGPSVAARIARTLILYARRNGGEAQLSTVLQYRDHVVESVHQAQDIIGERFSEPLSLAELAGAVSVHPRTLSRRFFQATGLTPLRYQQLLRLERALEFVGTGSSYEQAARLVGFQDARMLRRLRAAT